jgi:co-chaperonin GroES (HSP10)
MKMPFMIMEHAEDPKKKLFDEIGDLSSVDLFNTQVLVAVYIRPQRTKSGIYLTDSTTDEDKYQSKVGLVLKKGPSAFVDDSNQWFQNVSVGIGDWIVHRPSDGWSITVNGVLCRILEDMSVKGKIDAPDRVW